MTPKAAIEERGSAAGWIPVMLERLVARLQPLRIILFGSHARGDAEWDSNVDLLVVIPKLRNKRESTVAMFVRSRTSPRRRT